MANRPPTGYYRRLLPENLRIALTSQPMTGVTRHPGLSGPLAEHFNQLDDEHAAYYAEGLLAGTMVPVTPLPQSGVPDKWVSGELFFKS
jgi:hypothetical protein